MPPIFLKELSYFRTVIIMGYCLACLAPGFAQEAGPVFGSYEDRIGEIYSGYFDFSELDNNVILFLGEKQETVNRLIPDSIVKVEAGEDLFILTHQINQPYFNENDDRIYLYKLN